MGRKRKTPVQTVVCQPPSCPKCGCTDRTHTDGVIRRQIIGTTRDGFKYTEVVWSYTTCKRCEQRYRFTQYLNPTFRACGKAGSNEAVPIPDDTGDERHTAATKR